ncbi:hypothetical protein CEXT_485071 [Caerostris extrusa]|uniref:Uncharacterized protein n=1 Tax=Caerostris extrusa TaxID=172846 RepID=A0AAV4Q5Q1_CAEEX|nr:hypothetical protein CEXT_485071 [Caerostris extrusa]
MRQPSFEDMTASSESLVRCSTHSDTEQVVAENCTCKWDYYYYTVVETVGIWGQLEVLFCMRDGEDRLTVKRSLTESKKKEQERIENPQKEINRTNNKPKRKRTLFTPQVPSLLQPPKTKEPPPGRSASNFLSRRDSARTTILTQFKACLVPNQLRSLSAPCSFFFDCWDWAARVRKLFFQRTVVFVGFWWSVEIVYW